MNRIGALISTFSKGLGIESGVRLEQLRKEWAGIVGSPLSLHIWPADLKEGELLVNADSPAWLQQVTFFKTELVKKLGSFNVVNIRFRLGRVSSKEIPVRARPEQLLRKPLSPDEKSYIEGTVAVINDPELRECILKTIEKSMQTQPAVRKRG